MQRSVAAIVAICAGSLAFSVPGLAADFPAIKVYEQTSRSVVLIISRSEGKGGSVGSGSVISKSGDILTCAHVVIDAETSKPLKIIQVYLKPEKVTGSFRKDLTKGYEATVIAHDRALDLAVLRVKGLDVGIGVLDLANPDDVRVGEEVIAIGHPEQGGLWSLTYGRISGEIENQESVSGKDVYQTDTSINRGNSGGPLLDRRGYLVGVNANIARLGAGDLPITGINFAVKSSVALRWLGKNGYPISYGKLPLEEDGTPKAKEATAPGKATEGRAPASPDNGKMRSHGSSEGGEDARPGKKEDRILTPKNPYKMEDLLAVAEKDLENMMEEMRGRIRR